VTKVRGYYFNEGGRGGGVILMVRIYKTQSLNVKSSILWVMLEILGKAGRRIWCVEKGDMAAR